MQFRDAKAKVFYARSRIDFLGVLDTVNFSVLMGGSAGGLF